MKRSTWTRKRAQLFAGEPAFAEAGVRAGAEIVGRDFARQPAPAARRRGWLAPLLIGAVASALLLVSLRVEILRLRYAVMDAVAEEGRLQERKRGLTVEVRELRDPKRLALLAEQHGFARPERVVPLIVSAESPGARP